VEFCALYVSNVDIGRVLEVVHCTIIYHKICFKFNADNRLASEILKSAKNNFTKEYRQ